jgi:hypothetical protein
MLTTKIWLTLTGDRPLPERKETMTFDWCYKCDKKHDLDDACEEGDYTEMPDEDYIEDDEPEVEAAPIPTPFRFTLRHMSIALVVIAIIVQLGLAAQCAHDGGNVLSCLLTN